MAGDSESTARIRARASRRRAGRSRARMLRGALILALLCDPAQASDDPGHPTLEFEQATVAKPHEGYVKEYAFTEDWFSENLPTWRKVFEPMAGQPGLNYLEIGTYEGRSFFWMLENVLTHPTSRLTGIDIFIPAPLERRFLANVEASGHADRITTIKGYSAVELRKLPLDSFDIIYIDGSHAADDVLIDVALSWGLLKDGGILVFDDFLWDGSYYTGPDSHLPAELVPQWAISSFMSAHRNYFDLIHSGYQIMLRKRRNPCPNKTTCSPLGQYRYEWQERKLYKGTNPQPVALSSDERSVMEQILWNRAISQGGFVLQPPLGNDPAVRALVKRLGLAVGLPRTDDGGPAR